MRYLLTFGIVLLSLAALAQSNTFPSSGEVGIGTTSPENDLHITSGNSGDAILKIEADEDNNNESDNPFIKFHQDGNMTRAEIGYLSNNFFGIANQGSLAGVTRPAVRFGIDLTGKVGIGTTNPASTLDVNGKITVSTSESTIFQVTNPQVQSFLLSNDDIIGVNKLTINDDGMGEGIDWLSGRSISVYTTSQGGFNGFRFGTTSSFPYVFEGGNVGIGEQNPSHKLTVNGIVSATEVKVSATPNSDYVFEPDYDLKTIEEVDQFIQENKHLPDIPSAEEFKENGVGLGEMDDMLLRKVEELTLYVIELKKENEELKSKASRIIRLEEIVNELIIYKGN